MRYLNDIETYIIDWVEEKTGFILTLNQNFFDSPAFDSLSYAQLISAIEEKFDLEVSFTDLEDWTSVLSPAGLSSHIGSI